MKALRKPHTLTAMSDLHCTDAGNAQRFAARFAGKVRYCKPLKTWFIWDGKRFAPDVTDEVIELAKEVAMDLYDDAANEADQERRKALAAWAVKSERASSLRDMVYLARSASEIPVTPQELDRDPFALNLQNGTLDLRTGSVRDHDPKDLITRVAAVPFLSEAPRDLWIDFLSKIMLGRVDLVEYLQVICGLSLIGRCLEHKVFILYGSGRNGKTTFLEVFSAILGQDYASSVPLRAILSGSHDEHPTALASYRGLRFMYAAEPKKNARLDDGAIKAISGGDTQQSRRMRQNYSGGRVDGTLLLALNNAPGTSDNSVAMRERLRLIPFDFRVEPGARDNLIDQKLLAQGPGILSWAVEGLRSWMQAGNRFASEPAAVMAEGEKFWNAQDPQATDRAALPAFVEDRLVPADEEHPPIEREESHDLYLAWHRGPGKPLGRTTFYSAMEALGHNHGRVGRTGPYVWLGLAKRR